MSNITRLLLLAVMALLGSDLSAANGGHFSPHPGFIGRAMMLSDGAVTAYYVREGTGPTLVLVPGTLGDRSTFLDSGLVDRLLPNLRIVIVESRGQGKSWPPPTADHCSIEQYADDVLEVVGELKPARWYVGGHSLGGMIAIEIAGRSPPGLAGIITLEGWPHYTVEANAFPPDKNKSEKTDERPANWREIRRIKQRWTVEEQKMLVTIWKKWTPGRQIMRETTYPALTIWGDRNMPERPGRSTLGLPDKSNIEVKWIEGSDHYGLVSARFAPAIASDINAFITDVEKRHAH